MRRGYFTTWRKDFDSESYSSLEAVGLHQYLKFKANLKAKKWRGVMVYPGQLITTIGGLANETGKSVSTIKRLLGKLKKDGLIDTNGRANRHTVITICNPHIYGLMPCMAGLTKGLSKELTIEPAGELNSGLDIEPTAEPNNEPAGELRLKEFNNLKNKNTILSAVEEILKIYPRNGLYAKAKVAVYNAIVDEATERENLEEAIEVLLTAAKNVAKQVKEGTLPHPYNAENYFNGEGWKGKEPAAVEHPPPSPQASTGSQVQAAEEYTGQTSNFE